MTKTEIGCGVGCLGMAITFVAISTVTGFHFDLGTIWRAIVLTGFLSAVAIGLLYFIHDLSSKLSKKFSKWLTIFLSPIFGCAVCFAVWFYASDMFVNINDEANVAIFDPFISDYIQELKLKINETNQSGPIPGPLVIIDMDKMTIHPAHMKIPKALAAQTPEEVVTLVGVQSSWETVGTYNAKILGNKWVPGSSPALRHKYSLLIVDRLPNQIVNTVINHNGPMPDLYIKENLLTGHRYEIVRNKNGDILGVAAEEPNPYYWLVTKIKRLCNFSSVNPLPFKWTID